VSRSRVWPQPRRPSSIALDLGIRLTITGPDDHQDPLLFYLTDEIFNY
jgi:hypothetical protein